MKYISSLIDILNTPINKTGLTALIAGAMIGLSGCNGITDGEVYSKKYEPPRTYVTMVMVGKVFVPVTHYDPEHFVIHIKKFNKEKKKYDTNYFYINQEFYNKIRIGDMYSVKKD